VPKRSDNQPEAGIKMAMAKEYTTTTDCILKGLSCKDKASAGMAVLTMVASSVCMKKPQATSHNKTFRAFSFSAETESIFMRLTDRSSLVLRVMNGEKKLLHHCLIFGEMVFCSRTWRQSHTCQAGLLRRVNWSEMLLTFW
jgi:hypothetical protein